MLKMNKMVRKILIVAMACLSLFSACSKDHYNLKELDGIALDGEVCLPIATARYSFGDLFERFQMDSLITFEENGDIHLKYEYGMDGIICGSDFMFFSDGEFNSEMPFDNPCPGAHPEPLDTMTVVSQTIDLQSENILVQSATLRSGLLAYNATLSAGTLNRVVARIEELTDADGNPVELTFVPSDEIALLDLSGLHFEASDGNKLHLTYSAYFTLKDESNPSLTLSANLSIADVRIQEMVGKVGQYQTHMLIDTVFSLFPEKVHGFASQLRANMTMKERNGFDVPTVFQIDTAMVWNGVMAPYQLFADMPVTVTAPFSPNFTEVLDVQAQGALDFSHNNVYFSSLFTLNPEESDQNFHIFDTAVLDARIDADIPFAFNVDTLCYQDTVNMNLAASDIPALIDEIRMNLTFENRLPFNMRFDAMMYDSENNVITATLVENGRIEGSFDGTVKTSNIEVYAGGETMDDLILSNKIILRYVVNTGGHDITLNKEQYLDLSVRTYLKYLGNIDIWKD